MEQLNLFTYLLGEEGLYDPKNYAPGFEYMAFHYGDRKPIQAMNEYREYILEEIKKASTEEKRKQWENALESIERQTIIRRKNVMKDWTGNYHSVVGCLGAHNETKEEREEHDYYATQPIAAEWLIKLENLNNDIWECACGEGHLSKVFTKYGYSVKSTDLIDRGYGAGGVDFLKQNEKWNGDIVTNPPYKYAKEFIEHALEITKEGNKICMFLKVQFLEGKARRLLFENYPPKRIWVSSSRIQCGRNGVFKGSMVAYAWYVWEKGYKGETIIKWFN